jgi:hypothetical protein
MHHQEFEAFFANSPRHAVSSYRARGLPSGFQNAHVFNYRLVRVDRTRRAPHFSEKSRKARAADQMRRHIGFCCRGVMCGFGPAIRLPTAAADLGTFSFAEVRFETIRDLS